MKKLLVFLTILLTGFALKAQNPAPFPSGIRISTATEQQASPRIPVMDNTGAITGYINKVDLELALGNPTVDGQILSSTIAGVRSWISAGSGSGDFLANGTIPMTGNLQLGNNLITNVQSITNGSVGVGSVGSQLSPFGRADFLNHIIHSQQTSDAFERNWIIRSLGLSNLDLQIGIETGQDTGTFTDVYTLNSSGTASAATDLVPFSQLSSLGGGDVLAGSNFGTDNAIIKSDGTVKNVQSSGILIDDLDRISQIAGIIPSAGSSSGDDANPWTSIFSNDFYFNNDTGTSRNWRANISTAGAFQFLRETGTDTNTYTNIYTLNETGVASVATDLVPFSQLPSGSGHVIQDEGVNLTTRTNLNFVGSGVTVTDDSGNDATIVTIPGGSGDVSAVATPVDNQLAVWTGANTIEGTNGLIYNGSQFDVVGNIVATGSLNAAFHVSAPGSFLSTPGGFTSVSGQAPFGFSNSTSFSFGREAGQAYANGDANTEADLDNSLLTVDRNYQFPDKDGTFAMLDDVGAGSSSGIIASGSVEVGEETSGTIFTASHNLGFVPSVDRIFLNMSDLVSNAPVGLEPKITAVTSTDFSFSLGGTVGAGNTLFVNWGILGTGTLIPSFGIIAEGEQALVASSTNTITHNLGFVPEPERISVTMANLSSATFVSLPISNITTTTFDVVVGGLAGGETIAWKIFGSGNVTPVVEGHTILFGGVAQTQRASLNFTGNAIQGSDSSGGDLTQIFSGTNFSTSGANTNLRLHNPIGFYYNMTTANTNETFTISTESGFEAVDGGWAKVRINTANQPTVTGATLIDGADFIANTDMYMVVSFNGFATEYFFLKIAP